MLGASALPSLGIVLGPQGAVATGDEAKRLITRVIFGVVAELHAREESAKGAVRRASAPVLVRALSLRLVEEDVLAAYRAVRERRIEHLLLDGAWRPQGFPSTA